MSIAVVLGLSLGLDGVAYAQPMDDAPDTAMQQPADQPQPSGGLALTGAQPHELGHYAGVIPGESHPPPAMRRRRRGRNQLVTWPGFQPRPDGASRFFVQTTSAVQPQLQRQDNRVLVVLPGVAIHLRNNRRPLETRFFNTPVTRAHVERRGRNAVLVLEMRADITPTVSTDVGPDGYHFVYIEFPNGSFLPPEASQPIPEGRPQLRAGPDPNAPPPAQPPPPPQQPPPQVDTSMDNERPPALEAQGGFRVGQ